MRKVELILLAFTMILIINSCVQNSSNKFTTFTDVRDGKVYKTIIIGKQVWMAQNLNYKVDNSWCCNNDSGNCKEYGRLYDWETAKKACPKGWHLPGNDEWQILFDHLGGIDVAGGKMKESDIKHWKVPNIGATNENGFSALPGGGRESNGSFGSLELNGFWWSATELDSSNAWYRGLHHDYADVVRNSGPKGSGFSVRCIKN